MKIKSANGVSGHLIRTMGGKYFFRVYTEKTFSFKDYELLHSDLYVTIDDEDATLYEDGETLLLDHNPATLGVKYE
jgi:hypothetical protein